MKCEFCGAEISEGALACPRCGAPVTASPARRQETAGAAQPPDSPEPEVVPLAPLEEDFIAMAEATVLDKSTGQTVSASDTLEADGAASIADQNVPPGAHVEAEQVELDTRLTGGYKGPETASVAGAGEQTADDPFGLNITESAPTITTGKTGSRHWDFRRIRNVVVMIVALLFALSVAAIGIYYGFMRESEPSAGNPLDSVEEFFEIVLSGNYAGLEDVAVSDTKLISDLEQLLIPYERLGVVSLKDFEGETTSNEGGRATVEVKRLMIDVNSEDGIEVFDMMEMHKPFPVPSIINLVEQNNKWLVSG